VCSTLALLAESNQQPTAQNKPPLKPSAPKARLDQNFRAKELYQCKSSRLAENLPATTSQKPWTQWTNSSTKKSRCSALNWPISRSQKKLSKSKRKLLTASRPCSTQRPSLRQTSKNLCSTWAQIRMSSAARTLKKNKSKRKSPNTRTKYAAKIIASWSCSLKLRRNRNYCNNWIKIRSLCNLWLNQMLMQKINAKLN